MRASSKTPSLLGRFGRDWRYVLFACAVLAFIFGGALALGRWSGVLGGSGSLGSASAPGRATPSRPVALNTGRIVFSTTFGKTCRQMLIDNDTWHVTTGGTIDCDDVEGPGRKALAPAGAERFLDLRNGFGGSRE
jgi:hypothetical protein